MPWQLKNIESIIFLATAFKHQRAVQGEEVLCSGFCSSFLDLS